MSSLDPYHASSRESTAEDEDRFYTDQEVRRERRKVEDGVCMMIWCDLSVETSLYCSNLVFLSVVSPCACLLKSCGGWCLIIYIYIYYIQITATFGDAYDHPQIHDGYKDDDDYCEQPFRFVKNWSLWSASGLNPHVLPTDAKNGGTFTGKKYANAYLEGLVVPPEENSHYDAIKIRLALTEANSYVSVDRSKRYRGFWIIITSSNSGGSGGGNCYWLHEPDESIHPGAQKSQADVHFDHIAWLAVLSNLMDAVFTLNGGSAWANESVTDVYERLQTTTTTTAAAHNNSSSNNDNNKQQQHPPPPFDKDLLIQYKDKIYPHLLHSQLYLTEKCKFLQSLKSIKPPPKKAACNRQKKTHAQIQESTNAALQRSQQYPWGEPISISSSPIRPAAVPEIMQQQQQGDDDGSSTSDSARAEEIPVGPPPKDTTAQQQMPTTKKRKSCHESSPESLLKGNQC